MRQPYHVTSQTTSGGAMTEPTMVPPLKIPTPSARSLGGNHSPTTLVEPEKLLTVAKNRSARMRQRMVSGFNRPRNPADRIPGSARLTSLHRAGLFQAGKLALVCILGCAGCAGRGDVEIGFGFAFCSSFRN